MRYTQTYESPLGRILLAADDAGLTGLWFMEGDRYVGLGLEKDAREADSPFFDQAQRWLDVYFAGKDPGFVPALHLVGSDFRNRVGKLMLQIPFGSTTTYKALAQAMAGVGKKPACQAVGGAVGKNPICLIVPCHRVLGSDGSLTGYGGGLWRKEALLEMERGNRE